ncbi:MAG: arsenate reductase ArsC [Paludibacteraceae bacterium]|nr:arsenate reductase ArsC [Paludibacteraceae bacterium]
MKRILILCTGNSCRSQMAMGYLQSFDAKMEVHSAGTSPVQSVNSYAVKAMGEVGIDLSSETPKSVERYLDEAWDFVITVCGGANESCPAFTGKVGKRLHIGFDDPASDVGAEEEVMAVFRRVRDEIKKEMQKFYLIEVKGLRLPQCSCSCGK